MPHESLPPSDRGETESDALTRNAYGRYAGMGLSFALTIIAFGWIGWWLDGKLGTLPVFLIVGVLAGFVGGLISMVRRVPPAHGRRRGSASDSDGEPHDS